ncbi:MAG TPA: AAA-like domain-containing protein [Polyangiaceae bacterium]
MAANSLFVVGGRVQTGQGIYVRRDADEQLLARCLHGEYIVVLHSRQVGKSSLVMEVSRELTSRGVVAIYIDLSEIGTHATRKEWYRGLLQNIQEASPIDLSVSEWWSENESLSPVHRFSEFVRQVLLVRVPAPVVIIIDEIERTRELGNTSDDFFACVRQLYQDRDRRPELRRLSCVLSGSATPNELMSKKNLTPFNIGGRLDISDFTLDECYEFAPGFGGDSEHVRAVIRWIYHWTNGHPYLTQLICSHVKALPDFPIATEKSIRQAVYQHLLGANVVNDNSNLIYASTMLTQKAVHLGTEHVLSTYGRILAGKRLKDNVEDACLLHLKLSGVIVARNGMLEVRNRIYGHVFDRKWIRRQLPFSWKVTILWSIIGMLTLATLLYVSLVVPAIKATADKLSQLRSGENEVNAELAFETLYRQRYVSDHGIALTGMRKRAQVEYARFWERRARTFEQLAINAQDAGDLERSLMLHATAALKRNTSVPSEVQATFLKHFEDVIFRLPHDAGRITSAAFSRDGTLIVATPNDVYWGDGGIRIWDAATGTPRSNPAPCCELTKPVTTVAIEGDRLVAAAFAGPVVEFQISSIKQDFRVAGPGTSIENGQRVSSVSLSRDAARLLVAGDVLRLYDRSSAGFKLTTVRRSRGRGQWKAIFSPDGHYAATAGADGGIGVYPVGAISGRNVLPSDGDGGSVVDVDFSSDSSLLLAARRTCLERDCDTSPDCKAELWSVSSRTKLAEYPLHGEFMSTSRFCTDNEYFVTISRRPGSGTLRETQYVRTWHRRLSAVITTLQLDEEILAVDPRCQRVISVDNAGKAKLRNLIPARTNNSTSPIETYERWRDVLRLVVTENGAVVPLDDAHNLPVPTGPHQPLPKAETTANP